jgi:uncharacterized protein with HEPN domain
VDYKTVWKIKEENVAELFDFIQPAIDDLNNNSSVSE